MIDKITSIGYNELITLKIDADSVGERADKLLSYSLCDYSRSFVLN